MKNEFDIGDIQMSLIGSNLLFLLLHWKGVSLFISNIGFIGVEYCVRPYTKNEIIILSSFHHFINQTYVANGLVVVLVINVIIS